MKNIDKDLVEYYYQSGKMPERYYSQLNGKSAQENYNRQRKKMRKGSKSFSQLLETALKNSLAQALEDLFSGFKDLK